MSCSLEKKQFQRLLFPLKKKPNRNEAPEEEGGGVEDAEDAGDAGDARVCTGDVLNEGGARISS